MRHVINNTDILGLMLLIIIRFILIIINSLEYNEQYILFKLNNEDYYTIQIQNRKLIL